MEEKSPRIFFELPAGWVVETNEEGDSWEARKFREETVDGVVQKSPVPPVADSPFDVTWLALGSVRPGTDKDARDFIAEEHSDASEYAREGEVIDALEVMNLGGEEVSAFDWRRDDAVGVFYTTSVASFEKAGWVVVLSINDTFEEHEDAIAHLISTIRFER